MAWAQVWALMADAFAHVFDIFFLQFTPIGAGISIGALIFSLTIIHKIIDLLVPFSGKADKAQRTYHNDD